eukprot:gene14690-biopygen9620
MNTQCSLSALTPIGEWFMDALCKKMYECCGEGVPIPLLTPQGGMAVSPCGTGRQGIHRTHIGGPSQRLGIPMDQLSKFRMKRRGAVVHDARPIRRNRRTAGLPAPAAAAAGAAAGAGSALWAEPPLPSLSVQPRRKVGDRCPTN